MQKIAIVTDSNSGITLQEAKELGIYLISMPFMIDGNEYFEELTLSQDDFYRYLKDDNVKISTSQPSNLVVTELWDKLLKDYDAILHIPMSSGLSNSCATAIALSQDYKGRVFVIDNQRISVTQKQSVYDALALIKKGKSAEEIANILLETKMHATIYIMVDTMKYLKRGGRVTPAAAAIATVLNIRPVLQIHGEKLDAYCKTLSIRTAKKKMIAAMKHDLETFLKDDMEKGNVCFYIAHTQNEKEAKLFAEEIKKELGVEISYIDPLSLSVSCHIGPGSLAIAAACKIS